MVKEIWVSLPVKDVSRTKEFFSKLGFSFKPERDTGHSRCMLVGSKSFVVMFFSESVFKGFTQNGIPDTKTTEVLFSFDGESREEVDEMAKKVKSAGGTVWGEPGENQGWMYGFGFSDPDGHRWNMLYMDFSKMPK